MYSLLPISCPILKESIIDGKGHSKIRWCSIRHEQTFAGSMTAFL